MKTRVQIALVGTLLSVLVHLYLSAQYYALKFGQAVGQSLCNIGEKFNCDAVSASAYSSFFGIPLSIWGAVTNGVLFGMILLSWLEWTEFPERLRRWSLLLAGASVLASVIMGSVSIFLINNYCLFCIALYVMSLLIFVAYMGVLREPFWANLTADFGKLPTESRGILGTFIAIPLIAILMQKIYLQNFGVDAISKAISESIVEWDSAPQQEFVAKPALTAGPPADRASVVIAEFADFRCGHCKNASYTLEAFVSAHPDVRFEFYNFPLDGACNEAIRDANGISCRVAASMSCADAEGKGWALHKAMFERQEDLLRSRLTNEVDAILSAEVSDIGMNWETFSRCLNDPVTLDAVKAQAKQGGLVNVNGTPTIFANGRLLRGGQTLPVLQAVREKSLSTKR